ncbi:Mitochondrial Nuclease2 [Hibiscus trionum]|uniref:Mitochondrial Nuclease2 n=1 Tax=Hibiscus trionum TaxID=183268 RepID=A0A9W7MF26_HIBTR|nr:Mitochondrial Nuclease2 [Hibiscus trionum]
MNLKPFHLKTLVSSSSSPPLYSLSIFVSHFSTTQTQPLHSHSSSWRHEEASRQVKVSVWWDFENCSPPAGFNAFKIAHMITSAVRANGIKGPVQITAFGDISQLSRTNQEALSATGVNLSHVPNGGKNSADRSLLVDLLCWVSQNPPPAHLFLISGDRDFASVLHRLRMNNYNVLLATSESAPGVLRSAASVMWNWNTLLKGENLTGKHYNQPPDGPYGSWYGHYKVPLEDPFLVEQPPACTQIEELSESCSDSLPRPVPKAVIKQIRQILNSNPKGISITDLRAELKKGKVALDKDLYGYKRFSRFLLSMPQILRLQSERDGIFIIHGITPKAGELSKTSPCLSAGPVCKTGDTLTVSSRSSGDDTTVDGALNEKSRLHHSPEVNAGVTPRKILETPPENGGRVKVNAEPPREEVQQPLPVDQKIAEASNDQVPQSLQDRMPEQDSVSDVSFIRKVWQKWFGGSDDNPAEKDHNLPEKYGDSEDSLEKQNNNTLKKCTGVSSEREGMKEVCEEKSCDVPYPVTVSSSSNDSIVDTKASDEASENHSGKRSGLFNRIASWCKFWRSNNDSETSSDQSHEKLNQTNTNSLKHEVFTQASFWEDMEILIDSPTGSLFVTQSRTREEMAENLLKEGPLVLRSLSKTDLLHLVDLLISDKKWVEECPSQVPPFKITKAVGRSPSSGHSHAANGLRSIFLRTSSPANLQTKHEGEKKLQNVPHSGDFSSTIPDKKSSDRSRCEVLSDCQNLVKEILKEHPEGYHMGNFRKLFLERYGYPLDVQRLGYRRLVCLLEKIPGIKIESCFIIPARMVPDNFCPETAVPNIRENTSHALGELLNDATRKGDDFDTLWDELGPVSNMDSTRNELQSVSGSRRPEDTETKYPDYPSLSDDEFSDSERDISTSELSGLEQKPGMGEEDSSLLQILDSWYSSKEGKDKPDSSENSEAFVDCSEYNVGKPSSAAGEGMKTENCSEDYGKKQRVQKMYTFVADSAENDRDKLINGILGSLKKSSESRIEA